MFAFMGKADVTRTSRDGRFWPEAGFKRAWSLSAATRRRARDRLCCLHASASRHDSMSACAQPCGRRLLQMRSALGRGRTRLPRRGAPL